MWLIIACVLAQAQSKVGDPERPARPRPEVVSTPAPPRAGPTVELPTIVIPPTSSPDVSDVSDTSCTAMFRQMLDSQEAVLAALDKLAGTVSKLTVACATPPPPLPVAAEEMPFRRPGGTACSCGAPGCPDTPPAAPPPPAAAPPPPETKPATSVMPRYLETPGAALALGYHVSYDRNGKGWFARSQSQADAYAAKVPVMAVPAPARAPVYVQPRSYVQAPSYRAAPTATYAPPPQGYTQSYGGSMLSSPPASSCGPGGCGTSGLFGGFFR